MLASIGQHRSFASACRSSDVYATAQEENVALMGVGRQNPGCALIVFNVVESTWQSAPSGHGMQSFLSDAAFRSSFEKLGSIN